MLPVPRVWLVRAAEGEGRGRVPPRPWETASPDMFVLLVVKYYSVAFTMMLLQNFESQKKKEAVAT